MKTEYVIAGDWWDEHRGAHALARTVHEPEPRAPVDTKLLDASGAKIYRVERPSPVGFVTWSE